MGSVSESALRRKESWYLGSPSTINQALVSSSRHTISEHYCATSFRKSKEIGATERMKQRTKASFVHSKLPTTTYLAIMKRFKAMVGVDWTAEETRTLISLWGQPHVQAQQDRVARNSPIYEAIGCEHTDAGMIGHGNNAGPKSRTSSPLCYFLSSPVYVVFPATKCEQALNGLVLDC